MKKCKKQKNTEQFEVKTDLHHTPHRPEHVGNAKEILHLNLDELLKNEPKDTQQSEDLIQDTAVPHRKECGGRPKNLRRLKLAELLENEQENTESDEIDTGPAVGNEVW